MSDNVKEVENIITEQLTGALESLDPDRLHRVLSTVVAEFKRRELVPIAMGPRKLTPSQDHALATLLDECVNAAEAFTALHGLLASVMRHGQMTPDTPELIVTNLLGLSSDTLKMAAAVLNL